MNNKMFTWVASNVALIAAILLAVTLDSAWLRFVAIGFIWLMLLIYLNILFVDKGTLEKYRGKAKPAPNWTWWAFDVVVVAILMSADWYVTTVAYVASCVCLNVIYGDQELPG